MGRKQEEYRECALLHHDSARGAVQDDRAGAKQPETLREKHKLEGSRVLWDSGYYGTHNL